MAIKKVALVGATGHLGPAILLALESSFSVTVIQRESSRSSLPSSSRAAAIRVPDDFPHSTLVDALRDHEAVVVTMPGHLADQHIAIAEAAAEAGVQRFIPPDFGSVDSSDAVVAKLLPLYRHKTRVRERLQEISRQHACFSWTSLVCGHFFDYGLECGLLGLNLQKGTAEIFDGGDKKWSACTLARIGEAVVRVLQNPNETRDKMLYVQSFATTQNEVLKALKTSGLKLELKNVKSSDYIEARREKVQDGKDQESTEEMVSVLGLTRAYWEDNADFANKSLGLETQDVRAAVETVAKKVKET